ncbi:MAG: alpha-2-macroglobulin family protein, partial [Chitinophagaceae bacterium]
QLYGNKAANGVIIITTKTIQQRTNFRDYAFWQPELITDKNGIASFKVKYPDNVTGWQTFVIAMDKKLRIGKSITFTQSYKPLLAQLSVPRFLTERDSTVLIGKMLNYTNDSYKVKSNFSIKNGTSSATNHVLTSAASQIDSFSYNAFNTDTVNISYNLETETGFKDGETRKIPVEPYGTEEVSGKFWVLKADTTVLYSADKKDASLYISGENKVLDVLLKELDHLKQYPYWCMEQTASKLHGLLLEKQIQTALSQKFTDQKEIDLLIQKLQKAQQFDGGWPWWDGGKSNYYVTTHILKVLQQTEKNPIIQQNIRNGILYIQQLLPKLSVGELLEAMLTLSISGHEMNYETAMSVIHFDSLTQHEQWQWVAIRQKVGLEYHKQLKQLIEKNKGGITGSIYWGSENYRWYSNSMATTILAYKVLVAEKKYSHLLPGLLQYFLEEKKNGYWRNTVESAGVVAAILPDLLSQNKLFMQPASLKISGDTNFLVHDFPFRLKLPNNVKNIAINKIGGGISYVSVYQKYLNKQPEPVAEDMQISTSFEQGNLPVKILEAGKKATMHVTVTCKKNADYLMLEIPIPAGCVYAEKPNTGWGIHRAYFKNKVLIFAESLYAGIHNFDINLEVRYSGNYIINPAKSSLMYFPTFFGRNELKNILVK